MTEFQKRQIFIQLIDEIRVSLGYALRKEEISETEDLAMEMIYGGYEFALVHSLKNASDKLLIECVFGNIPEANEEEILLNILHMNAALAEIDGSVFCIDELTGKLVYTVSMNLFEVDANQILRKMTETVWHGRRWSETYFLRKPQREKSEFFALNTLA